MPRVADCLARPWDSLARPFMSGKIRCPCEGDCGDKVRYTSLTAPPGRASKPTEQKPWTDHNTNGSQVVTKVNV